MQQQTQPIRVEWSPAKSVMGLGILYFKIGAITGIVVALGMIAGGAYLVIHNSDSQPTTTTTTTNATTNATNPFTNTNMQDEYDRQTKEMEDAYAQRKKEMDDSFAQGQKERNETSKSQFRTMGLTLIGGGIVILIISVVTLFYLTRLDKSST